MTTIAYNHKDHEIACDSQPTSGNLRAGDMEKWVEIADGKVFMTGNLSDALYLIRQLTQGEDLDADFFKNVSLVVASKGKVIEYDGPVGIRIKHSWAWGSGRDLAIGALAVGASAAEAVKAAAKYDVNTGGKIHVFDTRE